VKFDRGNSDFVSCLYAANPHFRKRARGAVQREQTQMGQMVATMHETFSGIRVIKSFTREEHQENIFRRSNQLQFAQAMRMLKAMEAVGPLVETIAAMGVGLACFNVYAVNLSAAVFLTDLGNFSPLQPDQDTQQNPSRDAEVD